MMPVRPFQSRRSTRPDSNCGQGRIRSRSICNSGLWSGMSSQRPFVLGGWHVDPALGTLSRDGQQSRLEPRLMELLLLFAASPGRVLAKDEIAAVVWGGRAIGDDTLAAAVSRLRSALGESKERRFIETLPKRGYRLVATPDIGVARAAPVEDNEVGA